MPGAQAPVGTGQYKFVEWVAGDHMKVELNKDWWGYDADVCGGTALADADAGFKSITFKPVAESATVYLQFRQVTHRLCGLYRQKVLTP